MFVIAQNITQEIPTYERDENQRITRLTEVFSIGDFKSKDAATMVVVQCKELFETMLSTIRKWADEKRQKVEERNTQLEYIKSIILLTVEQQIMRRTQKL